MSASQLEICCYNIASVKNANAAGAHRIELCSDPASGGVTPSAGLIDAALQHSSIPVYVMIRPRGGDFLYSTDDLKIMLNDIQFAKNAGAQGVVFGLLKSDGSIDIENTSLLVEAAFPMQATFHRAIDMSNDLLKAVEELKTIGINNILTSGGKSKAPEGIATIKQMIEAAATEINIMAGSGVNESNIPELYKAGVRHFHASASVYIKSSMQFFNSNIVMGGREGFDEYAIQSASPHKIIAMLAAINASEKSH